MTTKGQTIGVGSVIKGRFVLEEMIGRGETTQVFKARDRIQEKAGERRPHVAMKIMSINGANSRQAFVAMQREAQCCQRLRNDGIVQVHDFYGDESIAYTIMELLTGRPLSALIQDPGADGVSPASASKYVTDIGKALAFAHQNGVVHSDLKPGNVFVTVNDEVKLIDFSHARTISKEGARGEALTEYDPLRLSRLSSSYASAEVLLGETADPRDDVYSLGCIAFELYAGEHPFGGADALNVRKRGLVASRPGGLTTTKWLAIQNALAFERERRTRDVSTFLEEFEQPDRARRVGDVLKDRFELVEEIGSGGMSRVFKALDRVKATARSSSPHVALKLMSIPKLDFNRGFVAMQREWKRCKRLQHPGIVNLHDFDVDGETVFLTMELLEGCSLNALIDESRERGVQLPDGARYVKEIGDALSHAHQHGIVHADLKPGNVFVTKSGKVILIDFGIARALPKKVADDEQTVPYDPRLELGAVTLAYSSPEMIGGADPDPRDDVYSLACTAYIVFAGTLPWKSALHAQAGSLTAERPPGLADAQWGAILHGLALDRDRRTPDVRTFLDAFNGVAYTRGESDDADTIQYRPPPPDRGGTKAGTGKSIAVGVSLAIVSLAVAAGVFEFFLRAPNVPSSTESFRDCKDCPLLSVVAAGTFTLGLPESERSRIGSAGFFEYPDQTIAIPAAFSMGVHEVTVGEFRAFAKETDTDFSGCRSVATNWTPNPQASWASPGFPQTDDHPVTCVSWNDAHNYVQWLSRTTGNQYGLPSEAQWAYVARNRAPSLVTQCESANVADEAARLAYPDIRALACSDGFAHTAPVNRVGSADFSDLIGNVFEWTEDCWVANYDGVPADGSARPDGNCSERVLRGGSWFSDPAELRPTFRNRFEQDYRSNTFGFRVVRKMEGEA